MVLGIIFGGFPLLMSEEEVGYLYTGAFVGALVGFALSGLLADPVAKLLARRNGGVYEPEFRLALVVPQTLLGVVGLVGFGWTTADVLRFGTRLPSFFFGLEVAGMVLGATASALYLVDAHRDLAIESFTCLLLFKNFFSFALTWRAVDWVSTVPGPWKLFWIVAVVQAGLGLLSVPMCGSHLPCRYLLASVLTLGML